MTFTRFFRTAHEGIRLGFVDQSLPRCSFGGMARRTRCSDAGYAYHVLNRAEGRATLFRKPADYAAFENILRQAWERLGMRLLSYLVMPNHWYLVVWPLQDGALSTYVQWLTVTHDRRQLTFPFSDN